MHSPRPPPQPPSQCWSSLLFHSWTEHSKFKYVKTQTVCVSMFQTGGQLLCVFSRQMNGDVFQSGMILKAAIFIFEGHSWCFLHSMKTDFSVTPCESRKGRARTSYTTDMWSFSFVWTDLSVAAGTKKRPVITAGLKFTLAARRQRPYIIWLLPHKWSLKGRWRQPVWPFNTLV